MDSSLLFGKRCKMVESCLRDMAERWPGRRPRNFEENSLLSQEVRGNGGPFRPRRRRKARTADTWT
jgi:hypothetical protein